MFNTYSRCCIADPNAFTPKLDSRCPLSKQIWWVCCFDFSNYWWLCPRDINLVSPPPTLFSPLILTNLVMGCFDFSSLSNPLPVALHDGQAQYCAWLLQPVLVGSSFPSRALCNLTYVNHTSPKWNLFKCIAFMTALWFFNEFWQPESHCFGCLKTFIEILSISKGPHKEGWIFDHLNVVFYPCYCLYNQFNFVLFVTLFINILYFCLIDLVLMLVLNLAFGWSNLTPSKTLLRHLNRKPEGVQL